MSDMLERYNKSTKPRPADAKKIPGLAVNFFDQNSEFQEGFVGSRHHGDPTKFTSKALQYYNEERGTILITDGFQPTEQGITLNRWTPDHKYFNPGQSQS